jgi:endo-1,4-beta-xylanase
MARPLRAECDNNPSSSQDALVTALVGMNEVCPNHYHEAEVFCYEAILMEPAGKLMLRDSWTVTRREALRLGLQCAALGALNTSPMLMAGAETSSQMALKAAGSRRGCQIGVAADKASLQDAAVAQFVVDNFNLLTASGMKWDAIHPAPDTYNFTEGDWNVNFAEKNGMRVHGHNLCWNSPAAYPSWFKSVLNQSNARDFLTAHIATVMKHYQGRVDSWDVVNEPVVPWSHRSDGLYPGIWLGLLGPEYIDIAFHAAALADSKPLRILNIYQVEQDTPDDELTRAKVITLLKQLVARGVPIQAVGLESHLDAAQPIGKVSFIGFIEEIRTLGLEVVITELDVMEARTADTALDLDQTVAKYYGDYIAETLSAASPRFLVFWSLQDRWYNGKRIQGLTWDHLKTRPSYQASLVALEQHSPRQP